MDSSENYSEFPEEEAEYDIYSHYRETYDAEDWVNDLRAYFWPYAVPRWSLIGLVLLIVFLLGFMFGRVSAPEVEAAANHGFVVTPATTSALAPGQFTVIPPYEEYTLTQGPHGLSYGHYAIDIAAGKGATIRSPIDGEVTAVYVDQYGNTRIILENDQYEVTLLHGLYSPRQGDQVTQGQTIGIESNQGYTTDMQGISCAGRNCGYHTHMNVYDKYLSRNVNPLELFAAVEAAE